MNDCRGVTWMIKKRAETIGKIRAFFDTRSFVEVDTPVRIDSPAPEEFIDCPEVVTGGFLRASPELQMKKILALGMEKIYQIGPCFRDGEKGSRHNPEFTMLEWYRKNATYDDIARDLTGLLGEFSFPVGNFRKLYVRDLYRSVAHWDPWENWDRDRFDFDMASKIEPEIASLGGGVFLYDYPPEAASLAKISGEGVAERWEFYFDGMEIANCFTELCDSKEQLTRFEKAKKARKLLKEADYPIDYEFISSVSDIGSAAGVALGVDRLLMCMTKRWDISSVRP